MTDPNDINAVNRTNNYGKFPIYLRDEEFRHLPGEVAMWADPEDIEESALAQIRGVAQLPGLYGMRVMPDVHWGNGATVGSVIAMEQALAPAAVGVDIGCGVNAVRTDLFLEDLDDRDLKALRKAFENSIPVGNGPGGAHKDGSVTRFDNFNTDSTRNFLNSIVNIQTDLTQTKKNGDVFASDSDIRNLAMKQVGTLGGGNHFIELCTDETGRIWITLHSGSRNIGKTLAEKHIDIARKDPRNADLPDHLKELSLFYKETPEMGAYLHDLNWAQEFAMRSRTLMMEVIKQEIVRHFSNRVARTPYSGVVQFDEEINCHHNYVAEEIIDGKHMIVTRKGAISAKDGELALIPGSMATGSYIVRGLGNPLGFQSASHGAGRKMSRNAAKKAFTVEQLEDSMKGIEARTDAGVLDEITYAYKDLDSVIAAQSDLVEVVQKLDTILCVKG